MPGLRSPRPAIHILLVVDAELLGRRIEQELRHRAPRDADWRISTSRTPQEALLALAGTDPNERLLVAVAPEPGREEAGVRLLEEVARDRPHATRVLLGPTPEPESTPPPAEPIVFLETPPDVEHLVDALAGLLEVARAAPDAALVAEVAEAPSEAVYRELVESVTDHAIFHLDPDGRIRSWNRGAARLMGYAPEEIIGRPVSALFPPTEVAEQRPQFILHVAAREGRHEEAAWRRRRDGTMFWANSVLTRIVGTDGRLKGFVEITRDFTERRHQDETLRESEERYRLLVAGVRDYAIFMLDPGGRVASWNAGAERIKGYTADEIVGEHFSCFYTDADRARNHPQEELRHAAGRGVYEEEGWRVRKDGSEFWASVVITALHAPDGSLRGFAKVTRDLTQRRLAEQALRARAADLAEVARELEAFNYTVAHDLRAPLRAILHLSELLADARAEPMPRAEAQKLLASINKSALRMGQLVEDLLMLSRATKGAISVEEVDLTAMARAAAADAARHLGAPAARIHVEEGLLAKADPRLLRIVMENLLSNAIKFSRGKPEPRVDVGLLDTGSGDTFYVRDNGVGFDERLADRLFRPFQRLHDAHEFEGTGIGLATVARIVARHGGRTWAESRLGRGTTFYFTLPRAGAQDPLEGRPGPPEATRRGT